MKQLDLPLFPSLPVTHRSVGAAGVAAYLLLGPSKTAFDVVAGYLGYGLLSVLCYSLIGGGISRLLISKKVSVELIPSTNRQGKFIAGHPVTINAVVTSGPLLPFFKLRITPLWPDASVHHGLPEVSSLSSGVYDSQFPVSLPHRGEWIAQHYLASYYDTLGLVRFAWRASLTTPLVLTVYPPDAPERTPCMVSSRRSSGDTDMANTILPRTTTL